ncbi:MAG TPA: SMP-30/gluconolactonase/LRE family protein [Caulobacteraceae bacterium]|nr:SMP-30/gluconolactonase/LRE family protein [Caulobacteraceae bacterium]
MPLELVAEGLKFPEGPVAMADGSIVLVEMARRTLSRVSPDGEISVIAELGGGPNGAAIGPDGAAYVCNNGGSFQFAERQGIMTPSRSQADHAGGMIQRVDLKTGAFSNLYDTCEGRRLIGPNDIVFDRSGGLWFTDHGCLTAEGRKFGGLYYARADGSKIVRARGHLFSPNGVGLSPDETVVYVADTNLGRLWAFDVAGEGVVAADGLAPGRVICNLQGYQLLDSLAVEASGKVCVATIINGGVTTFDPDGSTEHFSVPDPIVTNICFGGADMRDAWITASGTGKLYKTRWPRPGLKLNFNA